MNRLSLFLSSAAVLSVAALLAVATKPGPLTPKNPPAASSHSGALTIDGKLSHPVVNAEGSELYAEYTVRLDDETTPITEQPISMALVLDRSGSMSGAKMEDAKRAAHRFVDLLDARDELAFITFSDNVESTALLQMNAENKATVHAAIDAVTATGATCLSGGIERATSALASARGARRMVVVSDGQPTVGAVDEPGLVSLVARAHDNSTTVTALGVGAEYDGLLMQHLAERGGGMYGYLRDATVLEDVLGKEVAAARTSRVRNVELVLASKDLNVVEVPGRHVRNTNEGAVLHLADLRPGAPTRVLVRLQSRRTAPETELDLRATLRWRPLEGEAQSSAVVMATRTVDDGDLVTAKREESLWARGVSAAGSMRMVAAAAAYERGDYAGASGLLDNARAMFGMSADALAGQTDVDSMRRDFGNASGTQRKELSRSLEKKMLVN
ncbi:MAG: vWA domain-containing protein, partial [Archangium sp.]